MRTPAIALFALLVCSAAATQAASPTHPFQAAFDAHGHLHYQGTGTTTLEAGGILHHPRIEAGNVSFDLDVTGADVLILNAPYLLVRDRSGSESRIGLPQETVEERTDWTGTVRLARGDGDYRFLWRHDAPVAEAAGGLVTVTDARTITADPVRDLQDLYRSGVAEVNASLVPHHGTSLWRFQGPAALQAEGMDTTLVYGGTVVLSDATVQEHATGDHTRNGATLPAQTKSEVHDRIVLLVRGGSQKLVASGPEPTSWRVAARSAAIDWQGDLEMSDLAGTLAGAGPVPQQILYLQLKGAFQGQGLFSGEDADAGVWRIEGEATFVGVDGATVAGDRDAAWPWAVAAGAGIVGALAFTSWGKQVLATVGLRVASEKEALRHPVRRAIVQHLVAHQVASRNDLAQVTGTSVSTVRFHLRMLERVEAVQPVRNADRTRMYALNHGSLRFPVPQVQGEAAPPGGPRSGPAGDDPGRATGAGIGAMRAHGAGSDAAHADVLLAMLRKPHMRRIHDTLRHHGPMGASDILRTWRRLGTPDADLPDRTTVSRHANRLADLGILKRMQRGQHVLWCVAASPEAARSHARDAFLRQTGLHDIVAHLANGHTDLESLASALRADGASSRRLRRLPQDLRRLQQYGLVQATGPATYRAAEIAGGAA